MREPAQPIRLANVPWVTPLACCAAPRHCSRLMQPTSPTIEAANQPINPAVSQKASPLRPPSCRTAPVSPPPRARPSQTARRTCLGGGGGREKDRRKQEGLLAVGGGAWLCTGQDQAARQPAQAARQAGNPAAPRPASQPAPKTASKTASKRTHLEQQHGVHVLALELPPLQASKQGSAAHA